MIITNLREKILLFKFRYDLSQKDICREIGVSEQHFIRIMSGQYDFSFKLEKKIGLLFKTYGYTEALDDKGEL